VNVTGSLTAPSSGSWQMWTSLVVNNVPLTAGAHVMRVVFDTNGVTGFWGNLNYLKWNGAASSTP